MVTVGDKSRRQNDDDWLTCGFQLYSCARMVLRYTDMESEDYPFFQGLVYLLENDVSTLGYELTFSTEVGYLLFVWFCSPCFWWNSAFIL